MSNLAYVLHSRPYRETSLLLEVLTQDHGRIALVARGVKRGKTKASSLLQIFIPLSIDWFGDGELVTLTQVEALGVGCNLQAQKAICGLYINELLVKLLPKWDPCLMLFDEYQKALHALSKPDTCAQIVLRNFEKQLLKSLGYGLQLSIEIDSGVPVRQDQHYLFDPILGPRLVGSKHPNAISGAALLALEQNDFANTQILTEVKSLMRLVLAYHLGAKKLLTRELLY